ncbi:hypothetical protein [Ancylobacter amanitiformis]|uniref:CopL family metal-binding regulatory protein n=1 Tax=Ancylobacter amanitiformis TaxID=217069 RepID=A0ABU0LWZ2_9HYPH|nr:hypothetical protein [Ancylobacter amanitiformis]MDQ0513190.1 hypothetical protein [Ancylobacter amanitiformis]
MIFLTVLAFSATGTAWGIASSLNASNLGKVHNAPIESSQTAGPHGHGSTELSKSSACLEADGSDCASHHRQGDKSSSCCAMACHTAIPASACVIAVIAFVRTIDHPSLETGVKESAAARLERPPRLADV